MAIVTPNSEEFWPGEVVPLSIVTMDAILGVMMAAAFQVFGVHDWASRLPVSGSAVILCWLVFLIGRWAFSERAGAFSGTALATFYIPNPVEIFNTLLEGQA